MIPSIPLLFLLLVVVNSARIDPQQNKELQANCGRNQVRRKVINGRPYPLGMHPWALTVYVKLYETFLTGPGMVVSPRHILAYNYIRQAPDGILVVDQRLQGSGVCEGSHLILPAEANQMFTVGNKKNRTLGSSAERVIVVNGCDTLGNENIMILELSRDLNIHSSIPCLSNSADNWHIFQWFSVYGLDSQGSMNTDYFSPVSCSAKFPLVCAMTGADKIHGLCMRDIGGSAVGTLVDRYTVLGIYVEGKIQCEDNPSQNQTYKFINIGHFSDAICSLTGICALPPPEQVKPSEGVEETTKASIQTSTDVGEAILVTESSSNATENIPKPTDPDHVGSIAAETFEKMKLDEKCKHESEAHGEHDKNLHIHVHLNNW